MRALISVVRYMWITIQSYRGYIEGLLLGKLDCPEVLRITNFISTLYQG